MPGHKPIPTRRKRHSTKRSPSTCSLRLAPPTWRRSTAWSARPWRASKRWINWGVRSSLRRRSRIECFWRAGPELPKRGFSPSRAELVDKTHAQTCVSTGAGARFTVERAGGAIAASGDVGKWGAGRHCAPSNLGFDSPCRSGGANGVKVDRLKGVAEDLKVFVSETLTQIVEGVLDAQKKLAALGSSAATNPTLRQEGSNRKHGPESQVEFDVAVTVATQTGDTSGEKASAKVGMLSVVSFGASTDLSSSTSAAQPNEAVSRVRFSVKLAKPADITNYAVQSASASVSPVSSAQPYAEIRSVSAGRSAVAIFIARLSSCCG